MKYPWQTAMLAVAAAASTGCTSEVANTGPTYALLADPSAPMENSSIASGRLSVENGCLGLINENGRFYQLMLRKRPAVATDDSGTRLTLYSRTFIVGAAIEGEGQELPLTAARALVDRTPPSSLCADRVFLLNKIYNVRDARP